MHEMQHVLSPQRKAESERIDGKEKNSKGFSDDSRATNKIMVLFYVFEFSNCRTKEKCSLKSQQIKFSFSFNQKNSFTNDTNRASYEETKSCECSK